MTARHVFVCHIGYVERAIEAVERMKQGEHQHECETCGRWYWGEHPDEHVQEFGHDPIPSALEGWAVYGKATTPTIRAPRKWKRRPCPACPDVQRKWAEMLAKTTPPPSRRRRRP